MNPFTFQDFVQALTRLSAGDLRAACERYFRYRGMDPNTALVEKHFIYFLHFLELEELLREYHQSVVRGAGDRRVSVSQLKNRDGMPRKGKPPQISKKSSSLVERATVKLETIRVK